MPAEPQVTRRRAVRAWLTEADPSLSGDAANEKFRAYIHTAVDDLRGSVSADVLPEMAARLAHHRMLAEARTSPR